MTAPSNTLPALLTINDVASQLSVSRATVYNMIKRGKIRTVTPLGHQRVARSEFERLLTEMGAAT